MDALFFKRPKRRPLTPPRSYHVSSVFRGIPIKQARSEWIAERIEELIQRRRKHRNNGDIDDLTQPLEPPRPEAEREAEIGKWRPIFEEAFCKMISNRTLKNAVDLFNAASIALIAALNETTDAAKSVLQHWREAPTSLVNETKERLILSARTIEGNYIDNIDNLYNSLDGFFNLVERLEESGGLVLSLTDSAQYLGVANPRIRELVQEGLLHPIIRLNRLGNAFQCFTVPDLDNAIRLLAERQANRKKEPKDDDVKPVKITFKNRRGNPNIREIHRKYLEKKKLEEKRRQRN